ncbi:hypothetical protein ACTHRZ_11570, partial [Neisseria sp. P0001.S006]|uniref:hypothetical protein n=1 Tax=Neisseria sp. P0001.S006 TaxID=3436650 RepID=UPI003F806B3E
LHSSHVAAIVIFLRVKIFYLFPIQTVRIGVKVFHFEHGYILVQKVATVSHKYIGKKAGLKI